MPNGTYGGVRGLKTKVGRKQLRFPPTRFLFIVLVMSIKSVPALSWCKGINLFLLYKI